MAYKKLFEPGRIGGLTIRNRAVMSPMGTDLADIRGNATPRLIAYYTERAKGGIGLIINEYTGVDDVDSIPTQHNLRMAQDYNVQEAEELTRSGHAYGAKIFAQLHHGGATSKSAFTGRQNLSPSGVPMAPGGEVPREMTLEEIAGWFFISKHYLCRIFKSATGFSVMEYIIYSRILRARQLLQEGVSVQQAGELSGFSDNSHFIRTFGHLTGTSPGRYAKEYQAGDQVLLRDPAHSHG